METKVGKHYLDITTETFFKYKALADKTIARLSEEEMHFQPESESNSIAMLIQHMAGNMVSRFTDFLTTDGEKPDRNRDAEFIDQRESKEKLLARWEHGWDIFGNALKSLTEEDLLKTVTIREEPFTVLEALARQAAHYSYHIGQMVYLGKSIKGEGWESLSIPKGKSADFSIGSWKGGTEMVKEK